jgi:hypothetical protein
LQRYIENEPFEQGSRSELYARARNAMPKLLQAPKIQGSDKKEMEKDTGFMVLADDLIKVIESSILTFNVFLKMDKKKPNGGIHLFGNHNNNHVNSTTPLLLVQSSIDKVRFLCTQMLLLSYASLVSHKRGTFAEKGESKGAFKEDKRAEKEIMASNMGRCSTLVCSH